MSLIVEDGTGVTGAESYISVAGADARLANLGMIEWAGLNTAEKEQALRRATQYMEQAYRERWKALRVSMTQALSWPRWGVMVDGFPIDAASIPSVVANACADLAFKAASGDLNADLTQMVVEKGVGPLRKKYNPYSSQRVRYPSIEMALSPFFKVSGANVTVQRG